MRRGLAAVLAVLIAALACGDSDLGCPSELLRCGDYCTNAKQDRENCGGCGKVCGKGEVCQNSKCVLPECGFARPTRCGVECVDLESDENNCGQCGKVCPPRAPSNTALCFSGECD